MNVRLLSSLLFSVSFTVAVAFGIWWILTHPSVDKAKPAQSTAPARVAKVVKEEDLGVIELSESAEKRIGLQLGKVEIKPCQRARTYAGEVTIPAGQTILVAAPLSGNIKAPAAGMLRAGQQVKHGQTILELLPLLAPESRANLTASLADAEGQVNNARTQAEATKVALDRAKRVLHEGAGSQRQVDEAQAAFDIAAKLLETASARQHVLLRVLGDAEKGTSSPIPMVAPQDGLLRSLSALPGQNVPSGATLFELVDLSSIWVRVALPGGDLPEVKRDQAARITPLARIANPSDFIWAKPVEAPPAANPVAGTVDQFYFLPNPETRYIPGQRLAVTISLAGSEEHLCVPWSALVLDIHGNTWLYEQIHPHRYARRRVVVHHSQGDEAVLASGPPANCQIVITGVQELFGAETGFIK